MNALEKHAAKKNILSSLLKEIKASPSVISGSKVRKAKAGRARADKRYKKFKADEASYGKKAKEINDKLGDETLDRSAFKKLFKKETKVMRKRREAKNAAGFANADRRAADTSVWNEKMRRKAHLTGLGVVGTSAIGGAALYKRKKNKGTKKLEKRANMNALEKYAAKRNLITKLSVALGVGKGLGKGIQGRWTNPNLAGATSPRGQAIRRGAPSYSTGNSTMPINQTPVGMGPSSSPGMRPRPVRRLPTPQNRLLKRPVPWKQPVPTQPKWDKSA